MISCFDESFLYLISLLVPIRQLIIHLVVLIQTHARFRTFFDIYNIAMQISLFFEFGLGVFYTVSNNKIISTESISFEVQFCNSINVYLLHMS